MKVHSNIKLLCNGKWLLLCYTYIPLVTWPCITQLISFIAWHLFNLLYMLQCASQSVSTCCCYCEPEFKRWACLAAVNCHESSDSDDPNKHLFPLSHLRAPLLTLCKWLHCSTTGFHKDCFSLKDFSFSLFVFSSTVRGQTATSTTCKHQITLKC